MSLNIQETIFTAGCKIGVEEVGKGVREIPIANLLEEADFISAPELNEMIDEKHEITVEWIISDTGFSWSDEVEILKIWNSTTGEIYREFNDLPENRGWTDNDEKLVSSLLMWGELA